MGLTVLVSAAWFLHVFSVLLWNTCHPMIAAWPVIYLCWLPESQFFYQRVIHMKDLSLGKSVQTGFILSRLGFLIVFQAYYVQTWHKAAVNNTLLMHQYKSRWEMGTTLSMPFKQSRGQRRWLSGMTSCGRPVMGCMSKYSRNPHLTNTTLQRHGGIVLYD